MLLCGECYENPYGEGVFPSTQRYYRRFLLFIIQLTATCFGRTTIFKQTYIY
jgi:hypothetical protein